MNEKITVVPYQQGWPEAFIKEETRLKEAFGTLEIQFYHIGSTSIPECDAKPIIDIMGVTSDVTEVDAFNEALNRLGYTAKGEFGMKQRRFFQRSKVHLHIFEETDPEVSRHLRFCAYLRAHPEVKKAYGHLKRALATQFSEDRARYVLGKEAFIKEVDIKSAWEAKQWPAIQDKPQKHTWTQAQILKAMDVNCHLALTYFAKYTHALQLVFEPDVTAIRSSIPSDAFNFVLSAEFTEDNVRKRIYQVVGHFSYPIWWSVAPWDTPSSLEHALQEQGFKLKDTTTGMYRYLDALPEIESPLMIERVLTEKQLKDYASIIEEIEQCPNLYSLLYSTLPPLLYQERAPYEMYVGYLDGRPIATCAAVFHANVLGIYYLSTLPAYRKKGAATALMIHLLRRAQLKGYCLATLQSSQQALSLYQTLGFTSCCQFKEFVGNQC